MNFKFIDILCNLLITIINYRIFKKMSTAKLEYIWLDGYVPTQNMRSKTKILKDFDGKLKAAPYGHLTVVLLNKLKEVPQIVY